LEALHELERSRATHLRYRRAFADRRRVEKAVGRRQPTRGDLLALDREEWAKDAEVASVRHPSRRERWQRP
jgi:hypothetical protein